MLCIFTALGLLLSFVDRNLWEIVMCLFQQGFVFLLNFNCFGWAKFFKFALFFQLFFISSTVFLRYLRNLFLDTLSIFMTFAMQSYGKEKPPWCIMSIWLWSWCLFWLTLFIISTCFFPEIFGYPWQAWLYACRCVYGCCEYHFLLAVYP